MTKAEPPAGKGDEVYRALWRIVDLAVQDTFARHPDYLTEHGRQKAQQSINKRVVGGLVNALNQFRRKR